MRFNEKRINIVIWVVALASITLVIINVPRLNKRENDHADATALRTVIAEAYININEDRDFVNTATEDQPMEVPEKYYTYVESVQGDGRVYVFVNVDGSVGAYFGSPEKGIGYYADLAG